MYFILSFSVCLFVTSWTIARQAFLFMEFSRQEYWSRLPCPPPGDLPHPETEPLPVESGIISRQSVSELNWLLGCAASVQELHVTGGNPPHTYVGIRSRNFVLQTPVASAGYLVFWLTDYKLEILTNSSNSRCQSQVQVVTCTTDWL